MVAKPEVELALLPGEVHVPLNMYPYTFARLEPGSVVTWGTFPKVRHDATEVTTGRTTRSVGWNDRDAIEIRHECHVIAEGRTHFMGMEILVADESGIEQVLTNAEHDLPRARYRLGPGLTFPRRLRSGMSVSSPSGTVAVISRALFSKDGVHTEGALLVAQWVPHTVTESFVSQCGYVLYSRHWYKKTLTSLQGARMTEDPDSEFIVLTL